MSRSSNDDQSAESLTPADYVRRFCKLAATLNRELHGAHSLSSIDESKLNTIVLEAWKASLITDEARPTRLALRYWLDTDKHPGCVRFTEPRPCRADEFARLAPAVGLATRYLVLADVGGVPRLVGIEDDVVASSSHPGLTLTMCFKVYNVGFVEILVLAPTRLRLTHGPIGLEFDRGEIRQFLPAWYVSDFHHLLSRLSKIPNNPHEPHHPSHHAPQSQARLQTLARIWIQLLRKIRSSGHGGAVLILPPGCTTPNDVTTKYRVDMPSLTQTARIRAEYDQAYVSLAPLSRGNRELTAEEKRQCDAFLNEILLADLELAHLISAIAGMAALDGAVLMSGELEVIGFGARVRVRSEVADGEVTRASPFDSDSRCSRPLSAFGLRHLSAHEFVALNPQGIAFVVSQDGAVRAFTNGEDVVLLHDYLELTDAEISTESFSLR